MPQTDTEEGHVNVLRTSRLQKRVAIIQSAYIPWKGFFDLIERCDEYIIFDSVQFAKRHWHNRNLIKTGQGTHWLTIPVLTKSRFEQPIDEVEISGPWADKHWASLEHTYRNAPYFAAYSARICAIYESFENERSLTRVNEALLRGLLEVLGIELNIARDRHYAPEGRRGARLLDLCVKANATHYLSGPSARDYLDEALFTQSGIQVEWMSYGPYQPYPQAGTVFVDGVSILDVIFNTGSEARRYVRPVA